MGTLNYFKVYPIINGLSMREAIILAVLVLVAVAKGNKLVDCHDHHHHLKWIVECTLNVDKEETDVAAPQDTCNCGIDWMDLAQKKITFSCGCAGVDLGKCSTDIQDLQNHIYKVSCEFGIGKSESQ